MVFSKPRYPRYAIDLSHPAIRYAIAAATFPNNGPCLVSLLLCCSEIFFKTDVKVWQIRGRGRRICGGGVTSCWVLDSWWLFVYMFTCYRLRVCFSSIFREVLSLATLWSFYDNNNKRCSGLELQCNYGIRITVFTHIKIILSLYHSGIRSYYNSVVILL